MTPIPEPYDITDIPHIAWVPNAAAWCVLGMVLALLAVVLWRRNTPRRGKGDIKIVDTMLAELKATTTLRGEIGLERASRISRRIVSHISGQNVLELTGEELRASISEGTPPLLKEIITAVASFEDLGYSPSSPQRDRSAHDLTTQLASLIEEYRNQMRAR
jgi:hypothetical protein